VDIIAHALYGATVCSRTGLAGGSKGSATANDWTVLCATLFGVLPDVVSMGAPFAAFFLTGAPGNFFHNFDVHSLELYRFMHSLIVALAASGLLGLAWRPLFVPSLAWALHVCMDALTHGTGKFQTTLFYPLSSWGYDGIRWWEHLEMVLVYWLLLPIAWLCLWRWRRHNRSSPHTAP